MVTKNSKRLTIEYWLVVAFNSYKTRELNDVLLFLKLGRPSIVHIIGMKMKFMYFCLF